MRFASITLIVFLLYGCGKAKPVSSGPTDKIIATVNGEPIYAKELKLALALRVKDDPSFKVTANTFKEQIDIMVNERLLLQGAEKNKSDIKIYTEFFNLQ